MKWMVLGEPWPWNRWAPDATARERAAALHRLGGAVMLRRHPYQRDPASGAGNCWCGRAKSEGTIHDVIDGHGPTAREMPAPDAPEPTP